MKADVGVRIHKAGRDHETGRVDDRRVGGRIHLLTDGNDFAVVNQNLAVFNVLRGNRTNQTALDQNHINLSLRTEPVHLVHTIILSH